MTETDGDAAPPLDRSARITDVAAAAGVSTATVSRALALPKAVRAETRQRVLEAVRRLGYTPNEAARSLRAGDSRMALVIIPYLYSGAFFVGVVNGVIKELAARGYTAILGSLDGSADSARRVVELAFARQVDGVIVLTGDPPVIEGRSVFDAGVPVVGICAKLERPGVPNVLVDDEACAVAQTRHLIGLGHRRLLYVSGIEGHYCERKRYAGFRKAARAAGLAPEELARLAGTYTVASGAAAALRYLELAPRPTGVVCASDEMAIGFIKTITGAGLNCPRDVSVVGFDGLEFSDYCEPTLTTIRQPAAELGAEGARRLLQLLKSDAPPRRRSKILPAPLLARASTGPAPSS